MIPILYSADETSFKSNGLGRLTDCISCTVTEERNGIYEAEFVYPVNGVHYSEIKEGCIIYCTHDDSGDAQPFDIYKRSAEINGTVTFNAHHISYRLANVICKPFEVTNASAGAALDALKANAINPTPFYFYTDKATTGTFRLDKPDSLKTRLGGVAGSILDVYDGGEYEWDKFSVTLLTARGVNNGVSIRYGKNMTDITAEKSIEGRYTGVVPFWKDDGGLLVMLPEYYILSSALPYEMAEWAEHNDVIIREENDAPIEFKYPVILLAPMDLSEEWEEPPTESQLRDKATALLAASRAWETEENIEVDFVALWQTPEYENVAALQRVALCDTVTVYFPAFDVEVSKKVVKVEYNVLLDRYNSLELGAAKVSFAEVITNRTVDLMTNYVRKGHLQQAIENATSLITGGLGGYVVFQYNADGQPEEILVMDTDDINTAVNVIRINRNGIGFSRTGYQGPFITAWTIDGHFVADFIDSGTLNASVIKAGTISSMTGGTSWNLNNGVLESSYQYTNNYRTTRLSAGAINFLKNNIVMGRIAPAAWGNDFDNKEGVVFSAAPDAVYIGIGHQFVQDGVTYAQSDIVINNGLDPNGITQRVIFRNSTYFQYNVVIGLYLIPDADGVHSCGKEDLRWFSVWTRYVRFASGAYIWFDESNDYLYTSKTIHQASDENLKNIFDYDSHYDDLLDDLEPIIYTWKTRPDGNRFVGLGARKTAALLKMHGLENSGFVGINQDEDGNEVYSIDYQELTVMLLHKVQKQQEEIKELKTQIESMLSRLDKLEGK